MYNALIPNYQQPTVKPSLFAHIKTLKKENLNNDKRQKYRLFTSETLLKFNLVNQ